MLKLLGVCILIVFEFISFGLTQQVIWRSRNWDNELDGRSSQFSPNTYAYDENRNAQRIPYGFSYYQFYPPVQSNQGNRLSNENAKINEPGFSYFGIPRVPKTRYQEGRSRQRQNYPTFKYFGVLPRNEVQSKINFNDQFELDEYDQGAQESSVVSSRIAPSPRFHSSSAISDTAACPPGHIIHPTFKRCVKPRTRGK